VPRTAGTTGQHKQNQKTNFWTWQAATFVMYCIMTSRGGGGHCIGISVGILVAALFLYSIYPLDLIRRLSSAAAKSRTGLGIYSEACMHWVGCGLQVAWFGAPGS